MKKYIVANWKMNQSLLEANNFFKEIESSSADVKVWVSPQSPYWSILLPLAKEKNILLGSQNISEHISGAYTGEVSVQTLKDFNLSFCLVGHSERRQYQQESSALCLKKIKLCLENNITPIYCIGETLDERKSNKTFEVLKRQLIEGLTSVSAEANILIAYEPVWAIGTGETATVSQAQEAHQQIKKVLKEESLLSIEPPVLYGGSVKPENAAELMQVPEINGALVGGASLKARDFSSIIRAAKALAKN
jgi:triosephosphate isomerase (TIM)